MLFFHNHHNSFLKILCLALALSGYGAFSAPIVTAPENHSGAAGGSTRKELTRSTSSIALSKQKVESARTVINVHIPSATKDCSATFVSKHEIANGVCEYGLITAAHCVSHDVSGVVKTGTELTRKIDTEFGTITLESGDIVVPKREYKSNVITPKDSALIFFRTHCDLASGSEKPPTILKLASEVPGVGETVGVGKSGEKYLQGKTTEFRTPDNTSEVTLEDGEPAAGIKDSGSPILSMQGKLVGVLSGGLPGGRKVRFSNDGPAWALEELKKRYPDAKSAQVSSFASAEKSEETKPPTPAEPSQDQTRSAVPHGNPVTATEPKTTSKVPSEAPPSNEVSKTPEPVSQDTKPVEESKSKTDEAEEDSEEVPPMLKHTVDGKEYWYGELKDGQHAAVFVDTDGSLYGKGNKGEKLELSDRAIEAFLDYYAKRVEEMTGDKQKLVIKILTHYGRLPMKEIPGFNGIAGSLSAEGKPVLFGKDSAGKYRPLRIDRSTGKPTWGPDGKTEPVPREIAQSMYDYYASKNWKMSNPENEKLVGRFRSHFDKELVGSGGSAPIQPGPVPTPQPLEPPKLDPIRPAPPVRSEEPPQKPRAVLEKEPVTPPKKEEVTPEPPPSKASTTPEKPKEDFKPTKSGASHVIPEKSASVPMSTTFSDGKKNNCVATPLTRIRGAGGMCRYTFVTADDCVAKDGKNASQLQLGNLTLEEGSYQTQFKSGDGWNVARRKNPPRGESTPAYNYEDRGVLVTFDTACNWLTGGFEPKEDRYLSGGKPSTVQNETLTAILPDGKQHPLYLDFGKRGWALSPQAGAVPSQIPLGTPIFHHGGQLAGIVSKHHGNYVEIDPYTSIWSMENKKKIETDRTAPQAKIEEPHYSELTEKSKLPKEGGEIIRSLASPLDLPAPFPRRPNITMPGTEAGFEHLVGSNCLTCHGEKPVPGAAQMPAFVGNWKEWEEKLEKGDPEARGWLLNFYEKTVETNAMLENAKRANPYLTQSETDEISNFVKSAAAKHLGVRHGLNLKTRPEGGATPQTPNPNAVKLIQKEWEEGYYAVLDSIKTEDPALVNLINKFDVIYDKSEVIDAHQFPYHGTGEGIGARPLKFSKNPGPPSPYVFDPNRPNTWLAPYGGGFGADLDDKSGGKFFLMSLPKDSNGRSKKIAFHNTALPPDPFSDPQASVEELIYPDGTEFAEILYQNVPQSDGTHKSFVYEIRTRKKEVTKKPDGTYSANWVPNVYRPYGSNAELLAEIDKQGKQSADESEYQKLASWVKKNQRPAVVESKMGNLLRDVNGKRVSSAHGTMAQLPEDLSSEVQKKLFLDKPLKSVLGGEAWAIAGGPFPLKFQAGAMPVTTQTCMGCHENMGQRFSDVMPHSFSVTAQYGLIQGSDGAGSFHRWSKEALKKFHAVNASDTRVPRPELQEFFEPLDRSKHSRDDYTSFTWMGKKISGN